MALYGMECFSNIYNASRQDLNTPFSLLSILFIWKLRVNSWILNESEAFIGEASKGDVVVLYFEPLATQHMKASGSPEG